ncbi:hypothetical protein ABZ419_26580 [Streptomyces cinnamoneus]|uniref:hypothetical protein n=1 Tax=Streptomyces cinnamoneus TaxID=53446 RepID=UPI0034032119
MPELREPPCTDGPHGRAPRTPRLLRNLYRAPETLDQRARQAPPGPLGRLGRLGSCKEMANAAAWPLSPLSGYATGQTAVDGSVNAGTAIARK